MNNFILTSNTFQDKSLYTSLIWLHCNADELIYSLSSGVKTAFYVLKTPFDAALAVQNRYGATRNTIAKLNRERCGLQFLQIPIKTEEGVVIVSDALLMAFDKYITDTLNLDCRERNTYCRVFFYFCYCCGGTYGSARTTQSLEYIAAQVGMQRQTIQATLKQLIADGWIIRYGDYTKSQMIYSHGYSYTLKDDILELIISSGNK